ncbi:hypothetical protein [Streptomyces sp. NPDC059994]|uniref:hypothetical protein n=1 Tax=Streptomyces sp. NPDC059994 TaxID=3347029 RepID=UPI00368F0C11
MTAAAVRRWPARVVASADVPFLAEIAKVAGARFTPRTDGKVSRLVLADSRPACGTFRAERHPLELTESAWTEVHEVRLRAVPDKLFTLHGFRLEPHPAALVNGHLVRQAW